MNFTLPHLNYETLNQLFNNLIFILLLCKMEIVAPYHTSVLSIQFYEVYE